MTLQPIAGTTGMGWDGIGMGGEMFILYFRDLVSGLVVAANLFISSGFLRIDQGLARQLSSHSVCEKC